jgi:hypothetical protein
MTLRQVSGIARPLEFAVTIRAAALAERIGGFDPCSGCFAPPAREIAWNNNQESAASRPGLPIASHQAASSRSTAPRTRFHLHDDGVNTMIQLSLQPILALVAGILILVQPRLLNYIVAIYLIVIGILGLVGGV